MASDKLASVVLYLLRGCAPTRPSFTSLLKMIWFADYWHYQKHLATITDAQYVALPRGPVIDGYEQLFGELEAEGVLTKQEVPVQGHPDQPKQEYLPAMEPDEALLSQSELEVLNLVIERCGHKTGAALSALTHHDGPWPFIWNAAQPGRPIPYIAFRWLDNLPDDDDLAKARKAISQPRVAAKLKEILAA